MNAFARPVSGRPVSWRPVAARAASLLLRYPDDEVLAALPTICAALAEVPAPVAGPLRVVCEHRTATSPTDLAVEYVAGFDFRRRCCLHLTYYTAGDTRRRGEALVGFAAAYRVAGFEVTGGELPDFLPAVLDLAAATHAVGGPAGGAGWRLLRENRVGLDLLAEALAAGASPYRHAVAAVRAMLAPPAAADLAAAARLARTGPPVEQIGLEPYGAIDTVGGHR